VRRKLLTALAALATALATALPATARPIQLTAQIDNTEAPYVVVMEAQPVLGNDAIAHEGEAPPDPESAAVEAYTTELEAEKIAALDSAGIDRGALVASFEYAANGFSAALTPAEAESLAAQKGVLLVQRDELRQLHTSESPDFLGLDDWRGAWDSGFTGAGVVVGVIDTGIWPEHPSFAPRADLGEPSIDVADVDIDPDPATEFIIRGCDFGDTAHNPNDAPFTCNNKLIGARDMRLLYEEFIGSETYATARDYDGHGSHTASTAAGNPDVEASIFGRDFGEVSGIAPDAQVVAYSACGNLGCFGGDLAFAIDMAVADGVDVINYSIGSDTPGLTGADDIAFLFAAAAGVFVSTSAGNAGPGAGTVGAPASVPWVTTVGASLQKKTYVAEVRTGDSEGSRWSRWFKSDRGVYEGASITPGTGGQFTFVDAANHDNELCDPDVDFTGDLTSAVVLCLRGGPARVEKSRAVFEAGGVGMVLYNPDDTQDLLTDNHWVPSVHINFTDGAALKQYIADNGASATAEITDGEEERTRGNTMAAFSSRGPVGAPASDDIIKPDVTAPGVQILAGNSMTPTLGAPGELFQSISGTSMSSPHVAGLLALLKQAHPEDWTAAMAKSALMTTARQDVRKEDGSTRADPFDFGAGHVDPSGRASAEGSVFNPVLVYDAGALDYVAFLCDTSGAFLVPPLLGGGTCDDLAGAGFQTLATNLNYPSIAVSAVPGAKTVTRTVTNVSDEAKTFRARVDEPSGYNVTVSPDRITLAPGDSARFEVSFVNDGAPLDEWRFGSLTWQDGRNRVRSPIAVQAAAIEFPGSVSGTGADSSVEMPVAFGYTGAYAPAAHGLAPDALVTGSVAQDPDQTFDPANPEGTTAHPIPVIDAAFLRITLDTLDLTPPNPAIDIDLFLYNSAGEQVGFSVSGGTDEIIELQAEPGLPLNDTYTLYVHGWQTTGITVGYNLHTWQVPAAAGGGSLSIAAAPTEAVQGTIGTVVAGWSGLAEGNYLGAVSHSDGTTTFGYTLVEVDNTP
jgi:subtilisin family serine protease